MAEIMYLAIPYSHEDLRVRELRFEIANFVSAKLIKKGLVVFSPISHSHPMVACELPTDWNYWKSQDVAFLDVCSKFGIVNINGWETSKGVQDEHSYMLQRGIEIEIVNPWISWGFEFEQFVKDKCKDISSRYSSRYPDLPTLDWKEVV